MDESFLSIVLLDDMDHGIENVGYTEDAQPECNGLRRTIEYYYCRLFSHSYIHTHSFSSRGGVANLLGQIISSSK